MGLRIVYGRAGSGKSAFCLQEIKNKMAAGTNSAAQGNPLVLIVPEQFSLQAERNLARITGSNGSTGPSGSSGASGLYGSNGSTGPSVPSGSSGLYNSSGSTGLSVSSVSSGLSVSSVPSGLSVSSGAEVLSFRRLAFRVFSEVGGIARRHLNAAGKSMLLFRIMDRLGDNLKVFSKTALRKGFTEILSDAITEFKRYDIPPEQLLQTAERLPDGIPLKEKLCDLAMVYSEFESALHMNYMDADDDLDELCKKLDQSKQFDGAHIWIDEFSGFTPQEYNVIGKLLKKASCVTVCLCTDCLSNDPGGGAPMVFEPVRKTAARLIRLAAEEGIHVDSPVMLGASSAASPYTSDISPRFWDTEVLGHLERNFYKYPYQKYIKKTENVCIRASANLYSEVEDAARDVIGLCRDKGLRYRDIAVTMRNPDGYAGIVRSVFTRFGIPFFLDGKRDIDGHPLITFLMSALNVFSENWSYESVFRYAKTGLAGVEAQELDLLENYVLANGIRGNVWSRQNDWDYPVEYDDRQGDPSPEELERLAVINKARRRLAEPLLTFRSKTKGGVKAVEFCTALFELLIETGADKRIEELSQRFLESGRLDKANEYRQVWNMVMEVFSQIVEVLGEETLGTERFSEILAAGFAGHKMGLIPPSMDQVLVGSIERARSHDIKALFILGVNEGVLPGTGGDEGLLSNIDRDSLVQAGLELAGNSADKALEERFMIYMALATPSRYLYLSYPAADRDGRALRPSRVISEVKRILPLVTEQSTVAGNSAGSESECGVLEMPQAAAPIPAFDEMVAQLRRLYDGDRIHDGWRTIYKWFNSQEEWKDRCAVILEGLNYTNQAQNLSKDRAARLYGKPVITGISRMEAYSSCPFAYYVRYGLKARERRISGFNPVDAGTFMHNIIDEFSRSLVKKGIRWSELNPEWCREEVSGLVDKLLSTRETNISGGGKRYLYLSDRLKKTVEKAVMLIGRHIASSSFEPAGYEVEFGEKGRYPAIDIEMPSGQHIKMTGRIDRIDAMTNEDGTYLRIIDYKSGNRALKLGDVYYGLQLQLVTYLDAVLGMDEEEKALPAGILYFRLNDPLIRCGRNSTDEEIEKAIMKELRMKGLVLADVKLIKAMDRDLDGDSLIIPARINKDGSMGRSAAATQEQFGILRKHVRRTLAAIGSSILEGNVSISPYKKSIVTACTYCSFSSVCQFDTSVRGNSYRFMKDYKEDELWKLMRQTDEGAVPVIQPDEAAKSVELADEGRKKNAVQSDEGGGLK